MAASLRRPTISDASKLWRLVRDCGVLEENSCYTYLLLCRHFADTCVVSTAGDEIFGFVVGYRPPKQPDVIFVWQIGVAAAARGRGLGRQMLRHLVGLPACQDVRFLEATVTPTNVASRRMFQGFADDLGAPLQTKPGFAAGDFGGQSHEDEVLLRIGPW